MRWPFGKRARDVDDEIRSHLAMAEADRVDRGETPDEARVRAREEFGNVGLVTQVTHEMSGWTLADRLGQDIRHGWRRLWARPATTCLAIAMLGLAVGITTAMFTLVDAFLLRPFPFKDAERIAPIWMRSQTGGRVSVMPAVYRAWRESGVFESAEAASVGRQVVVDTAAGPTMRAQALVSPGLFAMLGVRAARGRTFDETDGRPGTSDRVAISEDMWRSIFAGDPQIIGRPVRLDGELATVVGVLPRNFRFPEWNTEIWRPSDFVSHPTDLYRLPRVFVKWTHGMPQTDALRVATTLAHGADRDTTQLWTDVDDQVRAGTFGARYVTTAVPLLASAIGLMFLALSTNTVRDVRFALRSFRRAPLAAFTIVATVAIGLGVVAVLFTVLNMCLFRVDTVPDISEMYAVERQRLASGDRSLFTRPQFEALRSETSVFADAYAALPDIDLRVDGRMMAVTLVTGNFFQVVGVKPVMGRALAPAKDESGGNPAIVLSDRGWSRQCNRDPSVLGRTVSGLFSVLSYLVEQRSREIGVRMALGASSRNVTQLILAQTTRPVGYGLLAGAGLAASLATILMATPAGPTITEIVQVTDPIAYAASLLVIVAACLLAAWIPAARAARLDPMRTLRQE